jgi:hypothetical protein
VPPFCASPSRRWSRRSVSRRPKSSSHLPAHLLVTRQPTPPRRRGAGRGAEVEALRAFCSAIFPPHPASRRHHGRRGAAVSTSSLSARAEKAANAFSVLARSAAWSADSFHGSRLGRVRPRPRFAQGLANAGKLALQPRDLRMNRIVRGWPDGQAPLPAPTPWPSSFARNGRPVPSTSQLVGACGRDLHRDGGGAGEWRKVQRAIHGVFFQKARLRPLMPSFRINPIASWRDFAPSRCA